MAGKMYRNDKCVGQDKCIRRGEGVGRDNSVGRDKNVEAKVQGMAQVWHRANMCSCTKVLGGTKV